MERPEGLPSPETSPEDAAQARLASEMLMQERLFGRESSFGKFVGELRELSRAKKERRPEIRERLEGLYDDIAHEQLDELQELQGYMLDLKNPYPYDSRWGAQYFDGFLKQVERNLRGADRREKTKTKTETEKGEEVARFDGESKGWLRRLKRDMVWGKSLFNIQEGLGPEMDFYYDGERQLNTLKTLHHKITAEDFEGAFAEKLPEGEVRVEKEGKGLRERAVHYQNDATYWKIAISSAGQLDYDNPPKTSGETTEEIRRQASLSGQERRLIYELFGQGGKFKYIDRNRELHEVPAELLNFYATVKSEKERRKYQALLEGLLVKGAKGQLENVDKDDNARIQEIAQEVREHAEQRVKNWSSPLNIAGKEGPLSREERLNRRLAEVVINSGIIMDWGFMSCGELGWGWKYEMIDFNEMREKLEKQTTKGERRLTDQEKKEIEEEIKRIEKELRDRGYVGHKRKEIEVDCKEEDSENDVYLTRVSKLGSIYGAFDVSTVMFWARHLVDYDSMSETRSNLIFPTTGEWRVKWQDNPPYKAPEVSHKEDETLTRLLKLLVEEEGRHFRRQEVIRKGPKGESIVFGDLHYEVKRFMEMEGNTWYYVTPFFNDFKEGDYFLKIPVFFPADIIYLNFWRNFDLKKVGEEEEIEKARKEKGEGKKPKEKEKISSVWQRLLEGIPLSSLDWASLGTHAVDWYRVNADMTQRWLGLMVNPHKFSQQGTMEYEKFFASPSTTSLKELTKRIRLGARGLKETNITKTGVLEIAVIPFLLTQSMIDKHNLMDRRTWRDTSKVNNWQEEVAKWINAAMTLPHSKGVEYDAVTPYGNSIAFLIFFYATLIRRYSVAASAQKGDEETGVENFIANRWGDLLKGQLNP